MKGPSGKYLSIQRFRFYIKCGELERGSPRAVDARESGRDGSHLGHGHEHLQRGARTGRNKDGGEAARVKANLSLEWREDIIFAGLSEGTVRQYRMHMSGKDTERLLELERSKAQKRTQKLLVDQRRQAKLKERTEALNKKNEEKVMRENNREERRQQKVAQREEKDRRAQEQKKAALKRAAELVESNRVPIEITRGATAAVNAAAASAMGIKSSSSPEKKTRSCIVVSTAGDLKQIVITAKNLWIKYNAIAKEHNQKVNWINVAKELGIHVKVREKYARMYARALHRGFDFEEGADCKIKDFPHIFLEPTAHENFKRAVKVEGAASQVLTTDKHLTTPKIEKEEEQVDQEGIGV